MGLIDKSQLDPIELWAKQHIDVICTFHPISDWSLIFARLNNFFLLNIHLYHILTNYARI